MGKSSVEGSADRVRGGEQPIEGLLLDGEVAIPADPNIVEAVIRDYPLEVSLADLVDNSIDAGARNVLIRFVKAGEKLLSVCVADDGRGIAPGKIDLAMRFAGRRKYGRDELGMFGIGLKSASLSQAEVVTVLSRAKGEKAVGRQWIRSKIKRRNWACNIVRLESVETQLKRKWGPVGSIGRSGTVIRWDQVKDFLRLRQGLGSEYLERAYGRIRDHLGLKLHRFLERKAIAITIDTEDILDGTVGPPSEVRPLRPFPRPSESGAKGYPRKFRAVIPRAGPLDMVAHVWPKRSPEPGYKLEGGKVAEHQGFYFYRHDRLIQDGGWNGYRTTNDPHMSLARVEIDIPDALADFFNIAPTKSKLEPSPLFTACVKKARTAAGDMRFQDFLDTAEDVYRRKKPHSAAPMVAPGDGVPAAIKAALDDEGVPRVKGRSLTVVWGRLPRGEVFDIHLKSRTLTLNAQHRRVLLNGRGAGGADLPVVRTLMYLLFERTFSCRKIGKVEKIWLGTVHAALRAAMKLETAKNSN